MSTPANRRRLARRHARRLSQTYRQVIVPATTRRSDVVDLDSGSCIDLTTDEDEIIDLTSIIDSPVVVLSAIDGGSTGRRRSRRRSQRQINRNSVRVSQRIAVESDDDDDKDLPAFDVKGTPYRRCPAQNGQGTSSDNATSPPLSISCPICMDDHREIRKSGRQIMSTNCGHMFCSECLYQAINAQHACPTCRKRLTLRQTHPLFL